MSFSIQHRDNRIQSYAINDFLNKTVGDAIRFAGTQFGFNEAQCEAAARQSVILAQATLMARLKGGKFVADTFRGTFVGELQLLTEKGLETEKARFNSKNQTIEQWYEVKKFAAREALALMNAIIK